MPADDFCQSLDENASIGFDPVGIVELNQPVVPEQVPKKVLLVFLFPQCHRVLSDLNPNTPAGPLERLDHAVAPGDNVDGVAVNERVLGGIILPRRSSFEPEVQVI